MCEDPCNDSVTSPIVTNTTTNVNNIASMINIGGEVEVYKNATVNPFELRTLKKGTEGNTVGDYGLQLVQQASTIDLAFNPLTTNTVWVDGEFGSDITGQVKHQTLKFQTIGAAVAACSGGNYNVIIAPGTYNETLPIIKSNIHLIGSPAVFISGNDLFTYNSSYCSITGGINLTCTITAGIFLKIYSFHFTECIITTVSPIIIEGIGPDLLNEKGLFIATLFSVTGFTEGPIIGLNLNNLYIQGGQILYTGIDIGSDTSFYTANELTVFNQAPLIYCTYFGLNGIFKNIKGDARYRNPIIIADLLECSGIIYDKRTSIKVNDFKITVIDDINSVCFTLINDDDNSYDYITEFNTLLISSPSYEAPCFILGPLSNGSFIMKGNRINTIHGDNNEISKQSSVVMKNSSFYLDIKDWKNNGPTEPNLFYISFSAIDDNTSVTIKGMYETLSSPIMIYNIKDFYLSGTIKSSKTLNYVGYGSIFRCQNGETITNESIVYIENFNSIVNDDSVNYATFHLVSNDPLRKYIFKNVKIANKGAVGANNVCIGSSTANTTNIVVTGSLTSNRLAASANLAFGTINNVTSPDLDLITNSNII